MTQQFDQFVSLPEQQAVQRRRLLRLPAVLDIVALSRSEWYRLIALGRAPPAVPLGKRARAWDEAEVQQFVAARIAARDAGSRVTMR